LYHEKIIIMQMYYNYSKARSVCTGWKQWKNSEHTSLNTFNKQRHAWVTRPHIGPTIGASQSQLNMISYSTSQQQDKVNLLPRRHRRSASQWEEGLTPSGLEAVPEQWEPHTDPCLMLKNETMDQGHMRVTHRPMPNAKKMRSWTKDTWESHTDLCLMLKMRPWTKVTCCTMLLFHLCVIVMLHLGPVARGCIWLVFISMFNVVAMGGELPARRLFA